MIEVRSGSTCPACGFTEKDFATTLMVGCPNCYEVFAANLETMLPKLQTGLAHVGKKPALSNQLRWELRSIESSLVAGPGNADELLDRWREVSDSLAQMAGANMP